MRGAQVCAARHLLDVCDYARGLIDLTSPPAAPPLRPAPVHLDLSDVRGQPYARRALEIAAAGSTASC